MLLLVLIVAIWALTGRESIENRALFMKFKRDFGKEYESTIHHKKRFKIFQENLERAKKLNDENPDATYGVTKFMDLTTEEFKNLYLMKNPIDPIAFREGRKEVSEYMDYNDIPTSWNWVDQGIVNPPKDQGQCGSCWAFSAVASIESQYAKKYGTLYSLSEEQLVDCDTGDSGCDGGLMDTAWDYVISAGGVESEDEYPYSAGGGTTGQCKFQSNKINASISSYVDLSTSEDKMASWCYQNGPISVALNADPLQYYQSGVFDPTFCSKQLDHAVFITGYGVDSSSNWGDKKYWIVKNSWGTDWGLGGYFWIIRGKGKCGINSIPCSSVV